MTTQSQQQTLEQRRAAQAWNQTERIDKSLSKKEEYGSLVRKLPAMIQTDGLGQTLAFLKAKAKGETQNEHYAAYGNLMEWLKVEFKDEWKESKFDFKDDLLEWLINQPSDVYRRVTSETQAYLLWLKRFAEAKNWGNEENGRD